MNLQQLEYIVAVDTHRHFVRASEQSAITQATLSMMIKKLEDELDVKIFDRSRQPVVPTKTGALVIAQAKRVLAEVHRLREIVNAEKEEVQGDIRIGIIPTLAPYLLPLFLHSFLLRYPLAHLHISELTTKEIIHRIQAQSLDLGLMATPLHNTDVREVPLFYERFVVYASKKEKVLRKKYVLADEIDVNRLWLLEEGHCLRSQVVNLCELKSREKVLHRLDFEAGSIETLKKIVEANQGTTILPELALSDMTTSQKRNVRYFHAPSPSREISIVCDKHFIKERVLAALTDEILAHVPSEMKVQKHKEVVELL